MSHAWFQPPTSASLSRTTFMHLLCAPMPISVSRGHFALRYEVPKFLARGGHLCMAVLTIAAVHTGHNRPKDFGAHCMNM